MIRIETNCPHCWTKNAFRSEATFGTEIVTCDNENGGCDQQYAVKWSTAVQTKTSVIDFK